ncbi:hypothetical protein CLIB1423_01S10484 [[Candida] railenensis]|uniref:Partial AB-hydrolase lipase domain-containing protein n=1 Tax=[Candida] railenensis TaxID=45579 RepID=A0A9P0QKR2_9ASCO|nr:hypothetical protein CLIB1423_01S10484 [[Candida] railenensis]
MATQFDYLTPPPKRENRGSSKIWIRVFSNVASFLFVYCIMVGSLFYELGQRIAGIATDKTKDNTMPNFTPRQPYKNIKKMKISNDLRFYAQEIDLDLEVFKITTEDGFILTLHHLFDPKETQEQKDARTPILLQHGLLSCSGAFLTAGHNSLACYFQEEGYDVWLGNNRSWFEAVHSEYEGNLKHNEKYWDWDVRDFAYYDLPCIIDNVLSHKPNHTQLILGGHSQGCTQTVLLLKNGNFPEHSHKLKAVFFLCPAIFPGSLFHHRTFIKFIHAMGPTTYKFFFGKTAFLPILGWARRNLYHTTLFGWTSYLMFKYLFGWNSSKWGSDKKIWHIHFVFNVSYVSTKLMNWWLSEWVPEGFSNQLLPKKAYMSEEHCAFTPVNSAADAMEAEQASVVALEEAEAELPVNGELIDDSKTFFPYKREWFGLDEKINTVPMLIFTGKLDYLVDGDRLASHMRHYESAYQEGSNLKIVELDDYSHLDVVWSEDAIGRVGYVVHDMIKGLGSKEVTENEKVIVPEVAQPSTTANPTDSLSIPKENGISKKLKERQVASDISEKKESSTLPSRFEVTV